MQLPRRHPSPSQPRLLFQDPSQAELWSSLTLEQQRTCQELLGQLLQQVACNPDGAGQSEEEARP